MPLNHHCHSKLYCYFERSEKRKFGKAKSPESCPLCHFERSEKRKFGEAKSPESVANTQTILRAEGISHRFASFEMTGHIGDISSLRFPTNDNIL